VYVAATRARDLLVVPTVGKEKIDGWLDPLEPALYPIDASRQNPQPAPGCPAFGTSTLVSGEDDSLIAFSVRPGLHAPQEGQHRVTWWDPHVLNLKVTIDAGLRHQKLLESDGVAGTAQQAAWMDWRAKRELTMASASKPSLRLETATNLATILAKSVGGDASVRHEAIASVKPDRPHGTRFGLLVHAVLAEVPLDGATPVVERTARVHARMLGCSEEEMTAAVDAVVQALQHPLLRAAAQSHDVRREAPLLVREASGEVVEAVVDLAWRDEAGWMVLDFKTDDADTVRRAQYEHQVRLYAEGIAAATGLRATPVLLSL
jgi:ATP-dependent exoDNAse (exonuclease V) beta subunit